MNVEETELDTDFYRHFYDDMRFHDDYFIQEHYKTIGRAEGRFSNLGSLIQNFQTEGIYLPSGFDESVYLALNPDVQASCERVWQASVHYLFSGRLEERPFRFEMSRTSFHQQAEVVSPSRWRDYLHLTETNRLDLLNDFDAEYYLERSPDLTGHPTDLFEHFLYHGWREHRDPSPRFMTSYYLETNPDIAQSGINPYVHYKLFGEREGRNAVSFERKIALRDFNPLVSVIVPNYNHARFLEERLNSVFGQTYRNVEVIILDDASTDNSVEIIQTYLLQNNLEAKLIFSKTNSGSPFKQWRTGFENASGEIIWICESDDFCQPEFLQRAVEAFRDDSVLISFGRIQFADEAGQFKPGLDEYREASAPGLWSSNVKRPAAKWFRDSFGTSNIIPNVGGCLLRSQLVSSEVWDEAGTYKIVGDWYLYLKLSRGGQIAYQANAVAYFRQHNKNTSVSSFTTSRYYVEHERLMLELRSDWGSPAPTILKAFSNLYDTYVYAKARDAVGDISSLFNYDRILRAERSATHLLICMKGFQLGGGEIFPIHLANAMVDDRTLVSIMTLDTHGEIDDLRGLVDRRIPIYDAQFVREYGINTFLRDACVDLIHSHYVGLEFFFFDQPPAIKNVPYVVTLHGSYESTPVPDGLMMRIIRGVDYWTYLTAANLTHLEDVPLDRSRLIYQPNGMPKPIIDDKITRIANGIESDAFVFCLASRAIEEKGWEIAIQALTKLRISTMPNAELLLIGDGPVLLELCSTYGSLSYIHFLGFRQDVCSFMAISDAVLLPSRFRGESYPLVIIQALQMGRPIIATDVGQIGRMLVRGEERAGVLMSSEGSDRQLVDGLHHAMISLLDDANYCKLSETAAKFGLDYEISLVADRYKRVYGDAINARQSRSADPKRAV